VRLAFFIIKNLNKKFEIGDVIGIIKFDKKNFLFIIYYYEKTFFKSSLMTYGTDGNVSDMSGKCTGN